MVETGDGMVQMMVLIQTIDDFLPMEQLETMETIHIDSVVTQRLAQTIVPTNSIL